MSEKAAPNFYPDFFPNILIFADGKYLGSYRPFKGGRGILSEWGGFFPFKHIRMLSDDRKTLHRAVYLDMSGYPHIEKHVRSRDLPEWLPEELRYVSWREAWAKRLDGVTSLDGLGELIAASCDRPLKIDRSPYAWWKNHAS